MPHFDIPESAEPLVVRLKQSTRFNVGSIGFSDHAFEDVCTVLPSFMELPKGMDHAGCRNLLKRAFNRLDQNFTLTDLSRMCRDIYAAQRSAPKKLYNVVSRITLTGTCPIEKLTIDGCSVSISSEAATTFREALSAKDVNDLVWHHGFIGICVRTAASDEHEAVRIYERVSLKVRGMMNLAANLGTASWTLFGTSEEPKNKVLNDRIIVPIVENDAAKKVEPWHVDPWIAPKVPYSFDGENKLGRRRLLQKYAEKLHAKSAFSKFGLECAQRYCRALDGLDPQYAFVNLWAALERILCLSDQDKYDVLIRRAKNLASSDPLVGIYLEHLRSRRNQLVHSGYEMESNLARHLLDQLMRIASSVLDFVILNPIELKTIDEFREYTSLPSELPALKRKQELIEKRIEKLQK